MVFTSVSVVIVVVPPGALIFVSSLVEVVSDFVQPPNATRAKLANNVAINVRFISNTFDEDVTVQLT